MNNKEYIEKIIKKPVSNELIKYFFLDKLTFCCDTNLPLMLDNINKFDYLEPIKKLAEYYGKDSFYNKLYGKVQQQTINKPLIIKEFDYDRDEILLQYSKCMKNLAILVIWPIAKIDNLQSDPFYEELLSEGEIHAIKYLNMSKKQIQGLIYQIYYNKPCFKDMNSIISKQKNLEAYNSNNKIICVFFEAHKPELLSGTDANLKVKFRQILKKTCEVKPNHFLHATDNHTELQELAQLFCNKNSIRLLQYQRIDRIVQNNYSFSKILTMTYKNWLYQNILPIDQLRFMLFSSVVLYSLGLRNINDLDLIVHYLPKSAKTEDFFTLLETFFINADKFPFVDISIKGYLGWETGGEKEYLIEWFEKEWPNLIGSDSMEDMIFNPKYHYYYFGMKIVSLEADTKRRIKRCRAAAYADIIALMMFTGQLIKIPQLPIGYWENHVYYEFTAEKINSMIKKIQNYLKLRYRLKLSIEEIKKFF